METKAEKKCVAVRVQGCFTEWYIPSYKEPYNDNDAYRQYFQENIIDKMPVLGPSLGDSEDENIVDDLECLAERIVCDAAPKDLTPSILGLMGDIRECLQTGEPKTITPKWTKDYKIVLTPYTKEELPPVNGKSLEIYGKYADLIRARVAAI